MSVFTWAQSPDAAGGQTSPPPPGGDAGGANEARPGGVGPALPAPETGVLPDERRMLDPSALPGLAIDRGDGAMQGRPSQDGVGTDGAQRAAVEQLRARNWLLDGVRRRELKADAPFPDDTAGGVRDWTEADMRVWLLTGATPGTRRDAAAGRDTPPAGPEDAGKAVRANATGGAVNPFSAYLAGWLAQADYAWLDFGAGGMTATGAGTAPAAENTRGVDAPATGGAAAAPVAGGATLSAAGASTGNPFVENIFAPILATPAPAVAGPPPSVPEPARQDGEKPVSRVPMPGDRAVRPADINAPPSAPLIDDRKYFPQLNRF